MKVTAYLGLLVGLACFTGLIAYQGVRDVGGALAVAGWGLIPVTLYHLLPLLLSTIGWCTLIERKMLPPFSTMLWVRWIGEAINALLPTAQIGGHIETARLLSHRQASDPLITASVLVDLTVTIFAQVIFTLIGISLLIPHFGDNKVITAGLVGTGVFILLLTGFYTIQKKSPFSMLLRILERVASGRDWGSYSDNAAALDAAILTLYSRRWVLLRAAAWRLLGWIAGTGEVWLALYFLGSPVSISDAFLLESLSQAMRAAAFMIPGALGIQEGGLVILGAIVGLGPEAALALSLCKRVREVLLGIPGLLAWQAYTGRRFWNGRLAGK